MKDKIFKIGTFNVCNLVLPDVKFYGENHYSRDDYDNKVNWIAHQLRQMNADMVGFQEVFHHKALVEAIAISGIYKNANIITANATGDRPVVGFVSRFPVIDYEVIAEFPPEAILDVETAHSKQKIVLPYTTFSRPVLHVRLRVKNTDMSVYVVHLKSKRPIIPPDVDRNAPLEIAKGRARSLMLRAAEATALRALLMKPLKNRSYPVVVMGDVNDVGLSVTSRIVSGETPLRNFPQDVKNKIWDTLLYHVQDIQARQSFNDYYYTHIHNGHYEGLDHIMVSQELVRENPKHIGKVDYVSMFNDHLIDETLSFERIERWKSDHGQVVASIEMK